MNERAAVVLLQAALQAALVDGIHLAHPPDVGERIAPHDEEIRLLADRQTAGEVADAARLGVAEHVNTRNSGQASAKCGPADRCRARGGLGVGRAL